MFGYVVTREQRHTPGDGAMGQVLDQLAAYRGRCHDVDGRDDPLHFAADVGGVPARPPHSKAREHQVGHRVPVDPSDRDTAVLDRTHRGSWRGEAELVQLLDPPRPELVPAHGRDLVGSGL